MNGHSIGSISEINPLNKCRNVMKNNKTTSKMRFRKPLDTDFSEKCDFEEWIRVKKILTWFLKLDLLEGWVAQKGLVPIYPNIYQHAKMLDFKLQKHIISQMSLFHDIKRDCYYYNWGGNMKKKFPTYPREYGVRCEKNNKFFTSDGDHGYAPSCYLCKHYKKDENEKEKND